MKMKINLSIPLQAARWFSYLLFLISVEVILVFPLANLLWIDFINRLIPNSTMHLIPLSNMLNSWTIPFDFSVIANSTSIIESDTMVRSDIPLEITINLGIYCTSQKPIESAVLKIDNKSQRLALTCFQNVDFLSTRFTGFDSVSKTIKKDMINEFKFEFPVNPDKKKIHIQLSDYTENHLLDHINAQFSVKYTGFRKFLLKWRITCHIFGTLIFASLISACFLLSFMVAFGYIYVS